MTNRRTAAVLLSLLLCGCSFFSRTKSKFYSLDRIPPAAPAAAIGGVPIAIDSIELPPGFDRREIVVRQPDHRLDVRNSEQWSASLEPLVLHTLAFDLAGRLPVGMVVLPGEAKLGGAVRSIDLVVEELVAGPESKVVLDARWTLHETGKPDIARHEQISIDIPSLASENIATGMSQAIAALADRIVAQLATSS